MTNKEIFYAAKSNNVKELICAIREPRQIHNAEYLSQQMFVHDMEEIKNVLEKANELILYTLEAVENNVHIRKEACLLLKDKFKNDIAIDKEHLFWNEAGWQNKIYCELCRRYLDTEDTNDIDNLYDQARMHRIETIISQVGINNILSQMDRELGKVILDTNNLEHIVFICKKIMNKGDERILFVKKLMFESLKNNLYTNEGRINQGYFTRVEEINMVMKHYFERSK